MFEAADHLESMAEGAQPRGEPMFIAPSLLAPGPAVGPAVRGAAPAQGVSLEPDVGTRDSRRIP